MAYDKDKSELPLPGENSQRRQSVRHLPKYFRSEKNEKFLQSTLDQLLQPGVSEKVNSFVGRKTAKAYDADTDRYLDDVTSDRANYQLEPVSVIKDNLGNTEFLRDYMDYINQIDNFGGNNSNHSRNNKQEFYSWNPSVDWDMFSNFREYYWLPTGPQTVVVPGDAKEITSTYTVEIQNALGDLSYLFTPDGATNNPTLKLYRGVKYRFEINAVGSPFTFRTARTLEDEFLLTDEVSQQNVEDGVIELTLGPGTPNEIYYVADNDINMGGLIRVANQSEATVIDVESEIIGKKYYQTNDGWSLTNGLKVRFSGEVLPAKYSNSEWYVEGVGNKIQLVSDIDVEVSFPVGIDLLVPFDDNNDGFDSLPFGSATGYPRDKDYITINRASPDGNFWSRYNRWFHREVIELSAKINNLVLEVDQSQRANRPIIQFDQGLKLYNFGTKTKQVVDLIDDYTTDAFSIIEGSVGYNIDSVQLAEGMRVLFLNDTDPLVKGRIFEVKFIKFTGSGNNGQISLVETGDTLPQAGENVLITRGKEFAGTMWYYDSVTWNKAQEKTAVNQPPVFDIFDANGKSYSDTSVYPASNFRGTKLFSYKEGQGRNDTVLGFPISYRSIENVGDIVFNFDFNQDTTQYQIDDQTYTINVNNGYLRQYLQNNQYQLVGAYVKANIPSNQEVVLQYVNDGTKISYPINSYDKSAFVEDLKVNVTVNNKVVYENTDYEIISTADKVKSVKFLNKISDNANVIIKTTSATSKNQNGFYEIAPNLEKNPLNANVETFTLGEVTDHVSSITQNAPNFVGVFPGTSNLRDMHNLSVYGRKFIKHSAPLNLAMFSTLDKESNVIKSLRFAKKEYSKFKRMFLEYAEDLPFNGTVKQHVDEIISEITKDKINSMPFYFSDMIGYGASITTTITIEDVGTRFYALTTPFVLNELSSRSVTVYLNGTQLIHNQDYVFNTEGYLDVTATKQFGDILEINEYETTNGTYIPSTPTKLGLYPKYVPEIFQDDTYGSSPMMIRGHDGSLIKAFDDYRDELILDLEKRIFNNIKTEYDASMFDINDYLPSTFRNTQFSRVDVYQPMITDFIQWLELIDEDYTVQKYYDRVDSYSWNYSNMNSPTGERLAGWWRGVYRQLFDTDRPHTSPWEMLGFTIKPTWWETQYGPAPYTNENLLLWEDLQAGIIRSATTNFTINKKYARPGLLNFIPVDDSGNLLSPSDSNAVQRFASIGLDAPFKFGDNSPIENVWRQSSDFPFALLTSWMINSPSSLLATGFDRSRQIRNTLGHIVYKPTMNHLTLADLVFPNTSKEEVQVLTSGIVNYISAYMSSSVTANFIDYKRKLKSIKNCLAFKLGGFTDKSKFKLILESRTPLNSGNVFIPEENYNILLHTSSPIKTINYSGVIVEKRSTGFVIRGYNRENPVFKWYRPFSSNKDIVVNIGGVSESFSSWDAGKIYVKGKNVQYLNNFYTVLETHTSTSVFETAKFSKLPKLPTTGGADAIFKERFNKFDTEILPYGSSLDTIQDVVDFLLGYEQWLKDQGFRFEYYDGDEKVLSDWKNSCREFMFWSTQNWDEGALIALSPVADEINFETEYSTVDNIFDNFYGYSLLKADGTKFSEEFTRISRQEPNKFKIRPRQTSDGVYAVQIPIIRKEHIVLLDNTTVFGDVIYQPPTGYRQDRIRSLGYRTVDWDGSLNIPGFIYDEAIITEWEPWADYDIGSLVKHKQFYYSANDKISGTELFDASSWTRLSDKPESKLLTNFEYKTNQFADFYDLDTDNFDVEQQKYAQHLIGYQNRDYLANIINDDVSQYKFYQGMIKEKGTLNSLNKLFDVLSSADKESIDFYEEWAIKQSQYGASEGFDEVEFRLDESKIRYNPQPFILTNNITGEETDLIYRISDFEVYKKPAKYNNKPLPITDDLPQFTKSPGYTHIEDVSIILSKYEDLVSTDFSKIKNNQYVWIGNRNSQWSVYQHVNSAYTITSIKGNATAVSVGATDKDQFKITIGTSVSDINVGDIIGIYDLIETDYTTSDSTYPIANQTTVDVDGFFKVLKVSVNEIIIETDKVISDINQCRGILTKFVPVRAESYTQANAIAQAGIEKDSLLWIDNDDNDSWRVIKNNKPFNLLQRVEGEDRVPFNSFAETIAVDSRNVTMAVSTPLSGSLDESLNPVAGDGKVFVYTRGGNNQNFQFTQIVEPVSTLADIEKGFGKGLGISSDGKYLIVGSPNSSNVKTKFKGLYDPTADYQNTEIVSYNEQLWEAVIDINGANLSQPFGSFTAIVEVLLDNNITAGEIQFNNLLAGNYPFENTETDHILVRAGKDQYTATGPGDTVFLDWYANTTANQGQAPGDLYRAPFGGQVPSVTEEFLESGLVIQKKIDVVLYIDAFSLLPNVGDQIEAQGVFGYVEYIYQDGPSAVIYVGGSVGIWQETEALYKETGEFVGQYVRNAPKELTQVDTTEDLGGYWWFNLPAPVTTTNVVEDEGRALAIYNVVPAGKALIPSAGGNIYDYNNTEIFEGDNSINSYIRTLTSEGEPGAYGNFNVIKSDLFVARAPKTLTDILNNGDDVNLLVLNLPNLNDQSYVDITPAGISYTQTNKTHTLYDLWDGFIEFSLDEPDDFGNYYEPLVGQFVRDTTTGATAQVAFYQRDSRNATIFVKDVQGTNSWSLGSNNGETSTIEMLRIPTNPSPVYNVTRELGSIKTTSLGSDNLGIGKLCVFQLDAEIDTVPVNDTIIGAEYVIYKDTIIAGLPTSANIPSSINLDWKNVYRVPVNADGEALALNNYGMYSVYIRENVSTFTPQGAFIFPEQLDGLRIGSNIKIAKRNDLYKAFIGCAGDGTESNPGRIYFVNNGTDEEGITYNWDLAKDKRYKGSFGEDRDYYLNDIVFNDGNFYIAQTNIANGDKFDILDWTLATDDNIRSIDYIGYIPNDTDNVYGNDSSLKLDATGLISFGKDFDISDDGEVLVVTAEYDNAPNKVLVYRNVNDNYQKYQEFEATQVNDGFGTQISVSQNGSMIAISAPNANTLDGDERGTVYIYTYNPKTDVREFELTQTLVSSNPIRGEQFGGNIDFDGNMLYVSAFASPSDDETMFDTYQERLYPESIVNGKKYELDPNSIGTTATTFDNGFTSFKNIIATNGVVYAYDRLEDSLIFGQTIDLNSPNIRYFGRNIKAKNNHLYVALPSYDNVNGDGVSTNKAGLILDYSRPDSSKIWETYRSPSNPVNLEKIKRVMLYDKDKNVILQNLDYIDPVQGKIAGPADEEIRYKSSFDPATYDVGTSDLDVDTTESWGPNHVGQVWWDLTTTKFVNTYLDGGTTYKNNNFNTLFEGSSVDVYEWVESKLKPQDWDKLSLQPEGESRGVTGITKYGASVYSEKRVYDKIGEKFTSYYYYWVKNKTTAPDIEGRSISVATIAKLIEDPNGAGYKFISMFGDNSFALHNCDSLIKGQDTILNIQYWTFSNKYDNIHNQYQILAEGLDTSKPNAEIEQKWFDSLVGYDKQVRPVPDPNLAANERYGMLNKPRQSWFINKVEAVKQLIERTNKVLKTNLVTDEKDISRLQDFDPAPSLISRHYDVSVDTEIDLQFVGVSRLIQSDLLPIVQDGKIVRVDIINSGRGYKTAPTYTISGQGTAAEFEIVINTAGQITEVKILNTGYNYNENTEIKVRPFTVLVKADSNIRGNWALYQREYTSRTWDRINSQAYDVTKYWYYCDWYAPTYSTFTEIDHVIDQSYGLQGLDDQFGDIVKILNVGTEGWLLLEKIDNQDTTDYTVNYKTIGKENGTLQLSENLYNFDLSRVGFDTQTFDTQFFDSQPIAETRIILEALRDNILVDDLATEYNKLFFASLRYVFAEQGYVDWAFKTSFVKAQHNVGNLSNRVTYKNDSLESYEKYINEVKPYKAKIREYVSDYSNIEKSESVVSDFDNPPKYNKDTQTIGVSDIRVVNGLLAGTFDGYDTYPNKFWLDNASYSVIEISIAEAGSGYLSAPQIIIEGNATAKASLGPGGKLSSVVITNPGSDYIVAPKITINGTLADGGTEARVSAKLGDSLVRSMHTKVKFDRVSGTYFITQLNETENFAGTGSNTDFDLKWPMDMRTNTIEITVNGELVLNSQYEYKNYVNSELGFDKYFGKIVFNNPPANNSEVTVNYKKSIDLLDAQDRVNLFYNPTSGQIGKDITQLMEGVDYGGAQVKSYEFAGPTGWDTDNWYAGSWDIFDETFDEETFETDGSTLVFDLSAPLQAGVKYNVYINGQRVDDDAWDGTTSADSLTNKKAFMAPIIGDGTTNTFTFENETGYYNYLTEINPTWQDNPPKEIITVRRSTSDGSLAPNEDSFDTALQGGDLAYTTALGIKAEEINVDGDGFVTPTTSKGPEETIPGQVLDTLDITVYERPVSGSSLMQSHIFKGDGNKTIFDLRQKPISYESVIVKINYAVVYGKTNYRIDFDTNQIVFYEAPAVGDNVVVMTMGIAGENILDYDEFIADGTTQEFLTNIRFADTIKAYVTVNGDYLAYELIESDDSYEVPGNCVLRFVQPPEANRLIQYGLFDNDIQSFSQVTIDEITADGSSTSYELSKAPFSQDPSQFYTIVTVGNDSNMKVLNAGYSEVFTVEENVLQYKMKVWQTPVGSLSGTRLKVFLNDIEIRFLQDWTFEGASSFNPNITPDAQPGSTVILNRGVAAVGDKLKVYVMDDGDYRFGYWTEDDEFVDTTGGDSSASIIHFDETYEEGELIRVYQFSNHDGQGIDREHYDVVQRTEMTYQSKGYYDYRQLKRGLIKLREEAVSVDYVWVSLNGRWLTPTADYILLENKQYIEFTNTVDDGDSIDIIHFSNTPISNKFGWRQFKDMLNRTHYKRLAREDQYVLEQPLNWYDRSITVVDKEGNLPSPDPKSNIPGVIFIDGERIEFFRKEENVLKQLRRGTLGTGVKDIHTAGTSFYNQSQDSTIPYSDSEENVVALSGEYKDMSIAYPNDSIEMSVENIAYNFNNNTVFPLGGQVATVDGEGFRPGVKVLVQDIECATEYVNANQLTFITPALSVGSYDLVIINPIETEPVYRPSSTLVVPKYLPYVQILLPYAPKPVTYWPDGSVKVQNPAVLNDWYTEDFDEGGIPSETYWEALDIEVFANGRRLRKNPIEVYSVDAGQFSPAGDVYLEAEYAVNKNVGAYVRLTTPPQPNTVLTIVRKQGLIWNEVTNETTGDYKPLGQSNTKVATFLRGKSIDLPR